MSKEVPQDTPPETDEYRQWYLDNRKEYVDGATESLRSFDKVLLTLSSGALALSITFLQQLAPAKKMMALFITAEIAFCITLFFNLLSFITSHQAFQKELANLEREYLHFRDGKTVQQSIQNRWATTTGWLNIISFTTFFLGIVFFIWFVIGNN